MRGGYTINLCEILGSDDNWGGLHALHLLHLPLPHHPCSLSWPGKYIYIYVPVYSNSNILGFFSEEKTIVGPSRRSRIRDFCNWQLTLIHYIWGPYFSTHPYMFKMHKCHMFSPSFWNLAKNENNFVRAEIK